MREPKTTDYCRQCGESPLSGSHTFDHDYQPPWGDPPETTDPRPVREQLGELEIEIERLRRVVDSLEQDNARLREALGQARDHIETVPTNNAKWTAGVLATIDVALGGTS